MEENFFLKKIADAGSNFFHGIWSSRRSSVNKNTENVMFESAEVGSVCDRIVSVRTTTITEQTEGAIPIVYDAVVLNINDGCDKEIETLLSKQDCIELMAYLSAATFALRD